MHKKINALLELFQQARNNIKPVSHPTRMTLRSENGETIEYKEAVFNALKISQDPTEPKRLYIAGVNPPPNTVAEIHVPKDMWHQMVQEAEKKTIDATDETLRSKMAHWPSQMELDVQLA